MKNKLDLHTEEFVSIKLDPKDYVANYERACQWMAMAFIKKYFGKDMLDNDWYWIGDKLGETLCVNDYFFNMDHIVDIMRLKPSKKKMFEWYEYDLDMATKQLEWQSRRIRVGREPVRINLVNYLKGLR